jgi:hypothetical protein
VEVFVVEVVGSRLNATSAQVLSCPQKVKGLQTRK